jgi:hypothetical protein
MNLAKDLREFIELLNSHDVRYVLVGGYAVAYHGYPRYTGDVDFFVDTSGDNPQRMEATLRAFGFEDESLNAELFSIANQIIQLGVPPNRIDILTSISGVAFADAWATHERGEIDNLIVPVISRQLLQRNKQAAARPKDLVDLDYL